MRILILTQKIDINDPVLGFFHRWVEEFAKYCEQVKVVCLFKGGYHFPKNVEVYTLGKEQFVNTRGWRRRFAQIKYICRFYKLIWSERRNYDAVFVHMNPIYVVFGGIPWRIFKKKIALWYTHKNVTTSLWIAEKLVNKIFTASKESFRLSSRKIVITGHGIDLEKFKPQSEVHHLQSKTYQIITAGRIAPIKNLHILIETAKILKNAGLNFEIKIAGMPILAKDDKYFEELKNLIQKYDFENIVKFVGAIPYGRIENFYQTGDLFVNLSNTGSIDKAVLEAIACGANVLVANEAFFSILPEENLAREIVPQKISERIAFLFAKKPSKNNLRELVIVGHSLERLIPQLFVAMNEGRA